MSLVVLSCDEYFTQSMQCLERINEQHQENIYIVDIDSFSSLHALSQRLLEELTTSYQLIFVKGTGILSKVLSPLEGLWRKSSVAKFLGYLREGKRFTFEAALTMINSLRELQNLTHNELSAACALCRDDNVATMSKRLNCTTKALYQRVSAMAHKMNLNHLNQIQYFISREYSVEELQKMDYQYQMSAG